MEDKLIIAGQEIRSRLIIGTGKYRSMDDMVQCFDSSGAEIVTVAIRRLDLDKPGEKTLLDYIDLSKYRILPNTAGSTNVDEALFAAKLGREVTGSNWVKLEVIPDSKYLLPDSVGTLKAAEILVKEGFIVLPYINPDPVLARQLEDVGCSTVMPLGSAIGSGQGIIAKEEIEILIESVNIPVVVDAGLGSASDVSLAMEIGADAVLVNTAIAQAQHPLLMAEAMSLGVEGGRKTFLAGRIAKKRYASASSPEVGLPRPGIMEGDD